MSRDTEDLARALLVRVAALEADFEEAHNRVDAEMEAARTKLDALLNDLEAAAYPVNPKP